MMEKVKIFLTVGSEDQMILCRKLISSSGISKGRNIFVVCDSENSERAGSGGAFLKILDRYYKPGNKLVLINSGGFCKRSINYALKGKAFASFFRSERETFLVENLIENAERFFEKNGSGILVCCGDILFDVSKINVPQNKNILFSVYSDKQKATRHGVFFKDGNNKFETYLHKGTSDQVEALTIKYYYDNVLLDTGFAFLKNDTLVHIQQSIREHELLNIIAKKSLSINLYSDIIEFLSKNCERVDGDNLKSKVKNIFYYILRNEYAYVCVDENQCFIHFGTHKECIENIIKLSDKSPLILNSSVNSSIVASGSVVENSILKNCTIGNGCLVSDVTLYNKKIENDMVVCGIKLKDGSFVTVITDTDSNPKDILNGFEIWSTPLFVRGRSFDESFDLFYKSEGEKVSLEYCLNNADYDYYFNNYKFINDMNSTMDCREYYDLQNSVVDEYFKNSSQMQECICKCDYAEINLPVRVNLSGTWTDAVPYCVLYGGSVVNMAVTVDGELPIKVVAERIDQNKIELCSDGYNSDFDFECRNSFEESDFLLHKAALKIFGIDKNTVIKNGFKLSTFVNGLDKGSGLGISSILLSGCLIVLSNLFGKPIENNEIIKQVFVAEQIMKTGGGWQDQAGIIFPSIKICESQKGTEQNVSVNQLELKDNIKNIINHRAVLVPTGQRHFGRFIVTDVATRCINKKALNALDNIKSLNSRLINALKKDDCVEFYNCINRHFDLLKQISPNITNREIESIASKLSEYCDAVSICGAGGGGYMLAIMKENVSVEMLQSVLTTGFPSITSKIKSIKIYEQGTIQ